MTVVPYSISLAGLWLAAATFAAAACRAAAREDRRMEKTGAATPRTGPAPRPTEITLHEHH